MTVMSLRAVLIRAALCPRFWTDARIKCNQQQGLLTRNRPSQAQHRW